MNIIIVDDDFSSGTAVSEFIEEQLNHNTILCFKATDALKKIQETKIDLLISDMRMPELSGIELLKQVKKISPTTEVVIMTGFGDMDTSIEALRGGAYDYLLKPIDIENLALIIDRIAEKINLSKDNKNILTTEDKDNYSNKTNIKNSSLINIGSTGKIGVFSDSMRNLINLADKFHLDRTVPILIEGETGTGKELLARLIHHGIDDHDKSAFIAINCSAISPELFESELFGYDYGAFTGARKEGKKGKIELAQGGTLFLDEIGEMPLDMQPKLLRVLQQKEMFKVGGSEKIKLDIRIVFATNRNLKKMVEEKIFRSDLFFRLNTGRLFIPPLRERKEAILSFAQFFLEKYSQSRKRDFKYISKNAKILLNNYPWPGNIRELKNTIERATLLFNDIELKSEYLKLLYTDDSQIETGQKALKLGSIQLPEESLNIELLENEIVRKALKKFNNNKTHTADYLGISRSALRSRINKLNK